MENKKTDINEQVVNDKPVSPGESIVEDFDESDDEDLFEYNDDTKPDAEETDDDEREANDDFEENRRIIESIVEQAVGMLDNGDNASITQFTFGTRPMFMADEQDIADVFNTTNVMQIDVPIDFFFAQNSVKVTFDFSNDMDTLSALYTSLDTYMAQMVQAESIADEFSVELDSLKNSTDQNEIMDLQNRIRSSVIPVMQPTIVPRALGGTAYISFADAPLYIACESSSPGMYASTLSLIYEIDALYCEDENDIYSTAFEDDEAMLEAYADDEYDEKKAEEEEYMEQFGLNMDPYADGDDAESDTPTTRGMRFKK